MLAVYKSIRTNIQYIGHWTFIKILIGIELLNEYMCIYDYDIWLNITNACIILQRDTVGETWEFFVKDRWNIRQEAKFVFNSI